MNHLCVQLNQRKKDIEVGYVSMTTNLSNFASIGVLLTELAELVKQTGDLAILLTSKHAQWRKRRLERSKYNSKKVPEL